jgi:uncharacterized phosphosugar-binding protein
MGDELARYVQQAIERAWSVNRGAVAQVADVIVAAYLAGYKIFAFGSGHSHLLVEEMYYRAAGLTIVTPIWDAALMLHEDAENSEIALNRRRGTPKLSSVGWTGRRATLCG